MNIFVLDLCPVKAAQMQCDKHIVKMILESGQMLSTAHRVLDGSVCRMPSKSGKTMVKHWKLPDCRDEGLYKAVHVGHPCTVWSMESSANYKWHYEHFEALSLEFEHRYGKSHKSWVDLQDLLSMCPTNIPKIGMTPFKLAMGIAPECNNPEDPVGSYRAFYMTKQDRFSMTWSTREAPDWFKFRNNSTEGIAL